MLLSMKLLIFAHTPPPHHGQSYMVQLLLAGFGGDRRKQKRAKEKGSRVTEASAAGRNYGIECYHINARLSKKLEDIGDLRIGKLLLLLGYCLQAVWCRYRYGVTTMYYIPAPGKPSALYRDWFVMLICRRVFKKVVLHWQAAGLADWLETEMQMRTRSWTFRFLKQVDLSIILSHYNRADAEKIFSRQIRVVNNGVPDPCPNFDHDLLARRKARFGVRRKLLAGETLTEDDMQHTGGSPNVVRVLFLALCTRSKGLFDAISGVALARQKLAERKCAISLRLQVAGTFVSAEEKAEFDRLMADMGESIEYFGFVSGEQKTRLLKEADLFCFPTYYENENQPVNLIEAMAFGLPILTTRWRSIPEWFPRNYLGLVDIRSPGQVANVMLALMAGELGDGLRDNFLRNFTLEQYLNGLADALERLEHSQPEPQLSAVASSLSRSNS
jgi:glycosyltransferase involved in cell wall biosynthesis